MPEIVSSPEIKNISLSNSVNQNYKLRHPGPHEGRFAVVTKRRAGVVMDALASGVRQHAGRNAEAYGAVVWSWRRDAGAKSAAGVLPMTVTTSPLTGESTK